MANRYLNGFDDVTDATDLAFEWLIGSVPTIVAGRTGNAVHLANANAKIVKTILPDGPSTVTCGFAFKFETINNVNGYMFVAFGNYLTTQIGLSLHADGTVGVYRGGRGAPDFYIGATLLGTSSVVVIANEWVNVQFSFYIHNTLGWAKVRFHGSDIDDIDISNVDTQGAADANVTWIGFSGGLAGDTLIDDVWVNDTVDSAGDGTCTGFLGDMRVDTHFPTANGAHTDWTPSTGTNHAALLDEATCDTTDYVSTTTLNAIDTFDCEDFKNDGADIQAIQLCVLASKSDAGASQFKTIVRESGADTPGDTMLYPAVSWAFRHQNLTIAEADAKRAAAGFNAAEYGIKKL